MTKLSATIVASAILSFVIGCGNEGSRVPSSDAGDTSDFEVSGTIEGLEGTISLQLYVNGFTVEELLVSENGRFVFDTLLYSRGRIALFASGERKELTCEESEDFARRDFLVGDPEEFAIYCEWDITRAQLLLRTPPLLGYRALYGNGGFWPTEVTGFTTLMGEMATIRSNLLNDEHLVRINGEPVADPLQSQPFPLLFGLNTFSIEAIGLGGQVTDYHMQIYRSKGLEPLHLNDMDGFGKQAAIDANTLAVGSIGEDGSVAGANGNMFSNATPNSGAVHVFVKNEGKWSQQAYLKASNLDEDDRFGSTIAIAGNTLVIAANGEDSASQDSAPVPTDNNASGQGAVYVFERQGTTWSETAYLKGESSSPPAPSYDRGFGGALAVRGDSIAIASPGDSSGGAGVAPPPNAPLINKSGVVFVYEKIDSSWTIAHRIKSPNPVEFDFFGALVALDDNRLVATTGSISTGNTHHRAYVFDRTADSWVFSAEIPLSSLPSSIGLSGNSIVIGFPRAEVSSGLTSPTILLAGAVEVLTENMGVWTTQQRILPPSPTTNARFGETLSLSEDLLIVGEPNTDGPEPLFAPEAGALHRYRHINGQWAHESTSQEGAEVEQAHFGSSVFTNGTISGAAALATENLVDGAIFFAEDNP